MAEHKKNYLWLWFFAFIFVASIGVAWFMIDFNQRLQLKPEQLADAMARWKERGPADYRLTVHKRINDGEPDVLVVKVRNRTVVEARLNGEPLRDQQTDLVFAPGHERLQYYTMDHLLREIERFLEKDAKDGKRNYNVAFFDEQTGALRRYVRREMGTTNRVEEEAQVEPLAP